MGNFIHFKLQQKAMTKFYKTQKKPLHLGHFLLILGKKGTFPENPLLSHISVSRFLLLYKISEKSNEQVLGKTGYRCMDR